MNSPTTTDTPDPVQLATLALAIYSTDKKKFLSDPSFAMEDAWRLVHSAKSCIARHHEEESERKRLEAERIARLVPFEEIHGYKRPSSFELAVRQALSHFNEPRPPLDDRIVVNGFVAPSHVEIVKKFKQEKARIRQARRRTKNLSNKKGA
jgi:hypothetical protein